MTYFGSIYSYNLRMEKYFERTGNTKTAQGEQKRKKKKRWKQCGKMVLGKLASIQSVAAQWLQNDRERQVYCSRR